MDKKVIQRFQDCWKGYLAAPDTAKWMDNIKQVKPDANDMMGVRVDTATAMMRILRTFVKMADPEIVLTVSKSSEDIEHYNHHARQLQSGLEATFSTYICEKMLKARFKVSKVVSLMTTQYLGAPYQKVTSKERAVEMLSDAVAHHLLGKEDHLCDFFAACRAIQDNFEACEIFDWLAGAEKPVNYEWTPEGQVRQAKLYEERMAAIPGGGLGRIMFEAIGGEYNTPPTLLH